MIDTMLKRQLRALIGRQVEYQGRPCQIVEVLDSEQALVVQCSCTTSPRTIQGNQFGEATRRVQACHTIKLYDETQQLDPDIRHWLDQATP
jgi:hypothetical protein